jgi:cytochrome P450 / NADPH-cytochrome P450 reductase
MGIYSPTHLEIATNNACQQLLGNIPDLDIDFPSRSTQRLADLYGEIVQLQLPGRRLIIISSQNLANEVMDQNRFFKEPAKVLREIRALAGDGLFTSAHEDGREMKREEAWWKAHRLLVPAFGPLGLRKLFDDMLDISSQQMLLWDRLGEQNAIDCRYASYYFLQWTSTTDNKGSDQFTRLVSYQYKRISSQKQC